MVKPVTVTVLPAATVLVPNVPAAPVLTSVTVSRPMTPESADDPVFRVAVTPPS